MQPPIVLDPIVLGWRCHHRTHCCRSWRIDVPPAALRDMALRCTDAGDWQAAVRLLAEHPTGRRLDGSCALPMDREGRCLFLQGNLCAYRLRHGVESLPVSCAKFPFLGLLTPKRRVFGLSFTCPTALELFARQPRLELVVDHPGPPPTEVLCDLSGAAEGGRAEAAGVFWDTHWQWFEFLRAREGRPATRLKALAERAAGVELVELDVGGSLRSHPCWDPAAGKPLLDHGAAEPVLRAVYDRECVPMEVPDPGFVPDEDVLVNRYLEHRLLVPEFLMSRASLARLLGALFAAVARFRIERARGAGPLEAIAMLDRLLLHSDFVSQLFSDDLPEAQVWPSLALLALAR